MTRVLVTAVGGGVGQNIIKSLQNTPYAVVGVDGETLATGLYAVPKAYHIPYASSPGYVDRLIDICKRESCSLLFPGLDAELPVLAREARRFREIGVTPIVSSPEVVDICDDKLLTYEFLIRHGFDAPVTMPLSNGVTSSLSFPIVLKPRKGGARSRGVFIVSDERELSFRLSTVDVGNYIAQEHIGGEEYSCSSVSLEDRCYGPIVMRRILRDGDCYKAFVVRNSRIHEYIRAVTEALKPYGPCNFQVRLRNGTPCMIEINPRCSGITYCMTLAGFNAPLVVSDYLTHGTYPVCEIREISILRYWKELVVENSRIAMLQDHGALIGDGSAL